MVGLVFFAEKTMADDQETQAATALAVAMQVDVGSPTELADDTDLGEDPFGDDVPAACDGTTGRSAHPAVKLEKRKREKKPKARRGDVRPVRDEGDSEDEDLESPSKRASGSDDRPLTSREMRELLAGHMIEMKNAWGNIQGRVERVELAQSKNNLVVDDLQARTVVVEKDLARQRQSAQETATNLESLTTEVRNMKVKMDELASKGTTGPTTANPAHEVPPDPWADFLRRRAPPTNVPDHARSAPNNTEGDKTDQLTEDEKRTLVIGGWSQDTRRATIEEEFSVILANPELKAHIDAEKITVYGPRRSVGMLKFTLRPAESEHELKERMWKIVRGIAALKIVLPSTKNIGEEKTLWASFVKTRSARIKSGHVSMIRRVCISLARDSAAQQAAGVINGYNQLPTSYDCDWNLGTIWCGPNKLGSASHRCPRDEETVVMTGGWVSLSAVAKTALCSIDEAKHAFEREL